jgi:regulator of ribonuclease activity A
MLLFGRRSIVAGRIRTVRCSEDNALVKSLLAQPSSGEILVVDAAFSPRTAILGDQIASAARAGGWAGVIVFGAVRDTATLETLDFHVKALHRTPRRSSRHATGEVEVPLQCGGIDFLPGHFLYSDPDGIAVLTNPLPASIPGP